MSKSIKQLKQQLDVLQATVTNLAAELEESYVEYFDHLSDSVGKQLTLAVYQICTQKYPENFLQLSLNKRYSLQGKIKSFPLMFNQSLADHLLTLNCYNPEILKQLSQIILKNNPPLEEIESTEANSPDYEIGEVEPKLTPDSIIKFRQQVDDSINIALQNISQTINRYLQKESILPKQIPPKILDMALQAEENTSMVGGSPNLLSLFIEKEQDSQDQERDITPITAICLRLSEIEFADPDLAPYRHQIRNILLQLDKIKEQYQQKQRQYAIAQAESAWRSSWCED